MHIPIMLPGVAALCFTAGFVLPAVLQADARQSVHVEPAKSQIIEAVCRPAVSLFESEPQRFRLGYVEFE